MLPEARRMRTAVTVVLIIGSVYIIVQSAIAMIRYTRAGIPLGASPMMLNIGIIAGAGIVLVALLVAPHHPAVAAVSI